MKPSVYKVEGLHLTAADKRSILESVEYLRGAGCNGQWLRRKGSPKRFRITPDTGRANHYVVEIETAYRTDYGRADTRTGRYVVELRGVEPMPPATAT